MHSATLGGGLPQASRGEVCTGTCGPFRVPREASFLQAVDRGATSFGGAGPSDGTLPPSFVISTISSNWWVAVSRWQRHGSGVQLEVNLLLGLSNGPMRQIPQGFFGRKKDVQT